MTLHRLPTTRRLLRRLPLMALLLAACAGRPAFDTSRVDLAATPRSAVAELPATVGTPVLWGGVILNTVNREASTRLEMLAYPLDGNQKPMRDSDPLGRFILERRGFLEPASYAEGRMLTAVGTVVGSESGRVGDSDYLYPVVEAGDLYLWPTERAYDRGSSVHFGVGVGIGF
jgi:outer membrane lipoprotein